MKNRQDLEQRYQRLRAQCQTARLLAVSKYAPNQAIEYLAACGQKDFAESRPQQLRDRAQAYPKLRWHFIGPLQKNKAKYVAKYASLWHSLNDEATALAVAKHVHQRPLDVLIQVNISQEVQKQGVSPEELPLLIEKIRKIPELKLCGLMGMAAKEGASAAQSFHQLAQLKQLYLADCPELSMGMSADYTTALAEGSSIIRLGSLLFGEPFDIRSH